MTAFANEGRQDQVLTDADFRLIAESIPHVVWMAAPDGSTQYSWQTVVGYRPADYPPILEQRGPGRLLISPVYDTHAVVGSPGFTPDFNIGGIETIRGGRLLLTAQARIGTLVLKASTPAV